MSSFLATPPEPTLPPRRDDALLARALRRVDGASLAVVRFVLGVLGVASALRLASRGWVDSLIVAPTHHLSYPGMSWVPVPGRAGAWALVALVALSGVAVATGWRYRCSIVVFAVAFTWLEFIEASMYLNHYWFVTLLSVLMCVLPADAVWSLDARRAQRNQVDPAADERGRAGTVPAAAVWPVRIQVGVVYVFAGIAKLHGDWLVRGQPLSLWLPARSDHPLLGPFVQLPHAALVASIAGALFDCTIVGFLLWRRSRPVAWVVLVGFHVVTWLLFPVIGVFPWVMIAMSTVFFDPDWPRRLLDRVRAPGHLPPDPAEPSRKTGRSDKVGEAIPNAPSEVAAAAGEVGRPPARLGRGWLVVAALWLVVQVALPLRHLAYPGDHRWTGQGYRFGWNVMLVEKAGDLSFRVTDPATGDTVRDDASGSFTPTQLRVLVTDPELIRQAAHTVAEAHGGRVEVRADAYVSLNGRAAQRIVDPDVDLAVEPWRLSSQPWILPAPTP